MKNGQRLQSLTKNLNILLKFLEGITDYYDFFMLIKMIHLIFKFIDQSGTVRQLLKNWIQEKDKIS